MGETSCKRCGGTGEIAPAPFERTRCPDCASPPSSSSPGDDAFREALDAALTWVRYESGADPHMVGLMRSALAKFPKAAVARAEVERVHREELEAACAAALALAEERSRERHRAVRERESAERALAEARAEVERLTKELADLRAATQGWGHYEDAMHAARGAEARESEAREALTEIEHIAQNATASGVPAPLAPFVANVLRIARSVPPGARSPDDGGAK